MDATLRDWLSAHCAHAPLRLRARVEEYAGRAGEGAVAERLAEAAGLALNEVLNHPDGGRPVALDLLAADALITLALLARAEETPAGLEGFAARLFQRYQGPS
ncbi:MAG: hypothetical protein AB7I33_08025 [Gemmatimonadales bacterium]